MSVAPTEHRRDLVRQAFGFFEMRAGLISACNNRPNEGLATMSARYETGLAKNDDIRAIVAMQDANLHKMAAGFQFVKRPTGSGAQCWKCRSLLCGATA